MFLDVINDCKKMLRKHMKTVMNEIVEEEEGEEETKRTRVIRKVEKEGMKSENQ
jgi:hypothetical protein